MKKGFVFDLDGVITDTAKYHFIAWRDLAKDINIDVDLKFNEQLKALAVWIPWSASWRTVVAVTTSPRKKKPL